MDDTQLKLLAAAIYELRLLLSDHLGTESESDECLGMAAHLSYAMHNDALAVLKGCGMFSVEAARKRIRHVEEITGGKFANNGNHLC